MSPTQRQIDLVEKITKSLGINFPTCSQDFSKIVYSRFISQYIDEYYNGLNWDEEDLYYDSVSNNVWTEFF